MKKVVIIDALRTPIGKYHGQFKEWTAVDLGVEVTKALLNRNLEIIPEINQVIFGNVLQAGNGQNPARQITLKSGLSENVVASTINEVCGSGLKALSLGRQAIQLEQTKVALVGGVESMTNAPSFNFYDRESDTYTTPQSIMVHDGLTDALSGKHMGLTAENVAEQYFVTREEQDAFAYQSHQKAIHAQDAGYFDTEIIDIGIGRDEGIRRETTIEKLASLKPVFKRETGSVTAGNASTINDGAAALLLAEKDYAKAKKIPVLAEIIDVVEIGFDPMIMGISPIKAIRTLLKKNQLALSEIDLFEINEAFAASSIVVEKELNIPADKVNICGGGISLGHPIGATGARIVTTAAHQLKRINGKYAIASLCVGGGLGLAILLKREPEMTSNELDKKFYQLSPNERLAKLVREEKLSEKTKAVLSDSVLAEEIANHLIENQISTFEVPLGIGLNLKVNGKKYTLPLATEEPSVIAALSNGAKMALAGEGFVSEQAQSFLRGQIVWMNVENAEQLKETLEKEKALIFRIANESYPSIVARGGGLQEIQVRTFQENPSFVTLDLIVDTKDAMGANIMNTILEGVAMTLRNRLKDEILFSILSNYATESLVTTRCLIPFSELSKTGDGKEVAKRIEAAAKFAQIDEYRAATNNKGIMNGINALILATGNDTRAVAAAIHTYAAKDGKYRGLSQWQVTEEGLQGQLTLPLALGTVGGATKVLPKAQASLELLAITQADELAKVVAAVGLAQNLAALRALVSEGIQKGHMGLQARSLALSVGARGDEIEQVSQALQKQLMNQKNAATILKEIRKIKNK